MMQRTSFELGNFKSAPATLALVIVTVLVAVALTLVASNLTTAGGIPSYTVIVDPDDETDAIDLATFTYGDAKTELLGIPDASTIKLLFPAEPGLGEVEMSATTISFDDADGVITFAGSSTSIATKFNTEFTGTWGTEATPELVLESVAKSDISTTDLLTFISVTAPSGLPELTLSNASLSVATSPVPAISVFADATFLGVSTSVLYSTADRDDDSGTPDEFLFGIDASSFALSAFGVPLPEPFSSAGLPVSMTVANAEQALSSAELTAPELSFFTSFYGPAPFDVSVGTGLNFAATVPFSALPNPIIKGLGLTPTDTVLLEGSVDIDTSFDLVALSLAASMPGAVSLPGLPNWISAPGGLSLEVGYDNSSGEAEISLAIAGDFKADLNGDSLEFHLGLQLVSGDDTQVEITGSTSSWDQPFGISWLTLNETSLTVGTGGALLESNFEIGTKTFDLSIEVTGSSGSLEATVTASIDSLSTNDLLALLAAAGIDTGTLDVPKVTLSNLQVEISTGGGTVGFAASADATILGDPASLLFSVSISSGSTAGSPAGSTAGVAAGSQLIMGIRLTNLRMDELIPALDGTAVGDFTMPSVALVATAGAGGTFESGDLTPLVAGFYEQAFGTPDFTLELTGGLNLISSIPPTGPVADAIEGLGLPDDPLLITGAISIPALGASEFGLQLSASLPPIETGPDSPPWLQSVQLSLEIELTTAGFSVGIEGDMVIKIEESGEPDTLLNFTVSGSFIGPPFAITISGQLAGDEPWVAPLGIDWLTINDLGLTLELQLTPPAVSFFINGDIDIGSVNIGVVLGLTFTAPSPVPTNIVLQATSTTGIGTNDLLDFAESLAGLAPNTIPRGIIPQIALRPISKEQPLVISYALLPNPLGIEPGFRLAGSLWADVTPLDGIKNLEQLAIVDISIGLDGVHIFGSIPQDFTLLGFTLSDPTIDIDFTVSPFEASFVFTGTLTTPWDTSEIRLELTTAGFAEGIQEVLDAITAEIEAWDDAIDLAAEDALAALEDLLDPPPQWLLDLVPIINQIRETFPEIDNVMDTALGGINVTIPAGEGLPNGGVEADGCPVLQPLLSGDRCYTLLPDPDGNPDGGVAKVCGLDVPIESGGRCYTIGPDKDGTPNGGVAADNCPVLQPFTSGGRCYSIPPFSGAPSGGVEPVCSVFTPHLVDGRCYSRTPGTSYQHWHHWLAFHKHTDTDGTPTGGNATVCPTLQPFKSGGRCYTILPTSGVPSGGVTKDACPLTSPFKYNGRCYIITPHNGVPSGGLDKDACPVIQPFETGGRCYFIVPNDGTPSGGVDIACDIFHPFPAGGRCYTFPPTPEIQLVHILGLCEIFTFIECTLDELLNGTVFDAKADEAAEILEPILVEPPDNTRPTADAGGPYKVDEGGSISLTAAGSTDPEGDTLTFAWDLDLDGTTDASSEVVKFSAVGLDGPGVRNVALTVSDGEFSNTTTVQVTISNVDPTVGISGATKVAEGTEYKLTLSTSDPGVDTPVSWNIDWGDGVAESLAGNITSVSHVYAGDTDHPTITAELVDEDGTYQAEPLQISVNNVAPAVSATGQKVDEGGEATISGTIDDPGSGDGYNVVLEWGDGTSTSLALPPGSTIYSATHTYADDDPTGTPSDIYAVSVTVTDDDGATGTAETSVKVNNVAPTLTAEGGKILENGTAKVSGSISDPGALDSFTVTVDWGEGTPTVLNLPAGATAYSAEHQYLDDNPTGTQADVYDIGVSIVDDDGGASATATTVIVNNVAPELAQSGIASETETLTLSHPAKIDEGANFKLSGSFKDPGTLDDFTILVEWGDGSFSELDIAAGKPKAFTFTHFYIDDEPTGTPADPYLIIVEVLDDDGGSAITESEITVSNVPPDVNAGPDAKVDEGEQFVQIGVHDGDGSYMDEGVDTTTATVDYGDGTGVQPLALREDMSFDLSHVYADDGDYTVTVEVTDDDTGVGSDTLTVTVNNVAPTVDAGPNQKADEGDTVSLAPATFNDKGTLDTHTATIDWGDLTPTDAGVVAEAPFGPPGSTTGADGTVSGSHVYADNGIYTVTVCVTDDDFAETCKTLTVTVNNVAPTPDSDGPYKQFALDPVQFSGSATDPSPVDTAAGFTWFWDFGDGGTSTEQNPSHAYALPGTYKVSFTVTDKDGDSTKVNTSAAINARPTELTNLGVFVGEYSDPVKIEARLRDLVDGSLMAGVPVDMTLGTQTAVPVPATNTSGIANSTIFLDQPAGTKALTSAYAGDAVYLPSLDTDDFLVLQENIESEYIGDQIVPTTDDFMTLKALINEEQDGSLGDLSLATVNFLIHRMADDSLVTTYGPIDVIPVDGMPSVGTAGTLVANLPAGDYYVVVEPDSGNAHYEGPPSTPAALTVYVPTGLFVTGGGRVDLDDDSHSTFSVNVRYNRNLTNVRGRSNYIFRQDGLNYFVKSNRLDGFAVQNNTALVQGRANIKTINPVTGQEVEIGGNFTFVLRVVDNGEPGENDTYEIVIRDRDGLVYHQVTLRTIAGGNILIHD